MDPGSELLPLLADVSDGDTFVASQRLCSTLEYWIPTLLAEAEPAWEWGALDGVFVARAVRRGPRRALLVGTCILLGDQRLTVFSLDLTVTPDGGIAALLRFGERGEGPLGLATTPYGPGAVDRLGARLLGRLETIEWAYRVPHQAPVIERPGPYERALVLDTCGGFEGEPELLVEAWRGEELLGRVHAWIGHLDALMAVGLPGAAAWAFAREYPGGNEWESGGSWVDPDSWATAALLRDAASRTADPVVRAVGEGIAALADLAIQGGGRLSWRVG